MIVVWLGLGWGYLTFTDRLTQLGRVDAGELLSVDRVESVNCVIAERYDLVDVVRELVVVVTLVRIETILSITMYVLLETWCSSSSTNFALSSSASP